MTLERKVGWGALVAASAGFALLFGGTLLQHPGNAPPPDIFCTIALFAALTFWPGYVLSVTVLLVRQRIRPSLLFCTALALVLAGLLLFAFSCRSAGYNSLLQMMGILCVTLGFASTWPFFRDVLSKY